MGHLRTLDSVIWFPLPPLSWCESCPGTPMQRATLRVHLVLIAVAILFSLNYILGKIALRHFQPLPFAWVRVASAALILNLWAWRRGQFGTALAGSDKRSLWLYAILGVVINQLLFITGLSMTTAHEAAILITTIPVFTLAAAVLAGREVLTARKSCGIALALSGALVVVGVGPLSSDERVIIGDLLILINCLSFSLFLVLSKRLASVIHPARMVAFMFAAGTLLMLPFTIAGLLSTDWHAIPGSAWAALAAIVVGPTACAYLLNAWALSRADSSTVAIYSYLQPFIAALLATTFLGEVIRPSAVTGAFLIFAGVFLVTTRTRPLRQDEGTAQGAAADGTRPAG